MKNGVARLTGTVSTGPWRLEAAVLARTIQFSSCGEAGFAHVLLSAMRFEFGGHVEKLAGK
jgi:6-phosphogluconate dehydrogenase (decarboxylating)